MKDLVRITAALLLVTSLSGCVVAIGNDAWEDEKDWEQRQERNDRYIRRLELGQSMTSIEADLGAADFDESFQRGGETFQVLYYRTEHRHDDGRTSKDESTPLVFIDRSLVGWGDSAIDNAAR